MAAVIACIGKAVYIKSVVAIAYKNATKAKRYIDIQCIFYIIALFMLIFSISFAVRCTSKYC